MTDDTHTAPNRRRSSANRCRWPAIALAAIAAFYLPAVASAQTNTFPSSGNVGIGTTSPVYPLDISGSGITALRINGTAGNSGSNNTQLRFAGGKSGELWAIGPDVATGSGSRDFTFWALGGVGPVMTLQNTSGNVGIGTTSPVAPLEVHALTNENFYVFGNENLSSGVTVASVNDANNAFQPMEFGASQFYFNGNVGIGTINPLHLLHVAGTVGAEEVIVSATGADYVFQPDYRLSSLDEVNAYIKENHHLPDVPSAAEMQKKGLSLGEMQTKLLAKVEELTLHMIQVEQENRELKDRIKRLELAEDRLGRPSEVRERPAN
jgi:hypothetical protein